MERCGVSCSGLGVSLRTPYDGDSDAYIINRLLSPKAIILEINLYYRTRSSFFAARAD